MLAQGSATWCERQRVAWLAAGVSAAPVAGCPSNTGPHADDPVSLFETVLTDFDGDYAFFPLVNVDWRQLHDIYRDSVQGSISPSQTARFIGGMIGRLGDGHADLSTPMGAFGGAPPLPTDHHFVPGVIEARYSATAFHRTPSRRIQYARVIEGTGYIYVGSFEGDGWGEEIDVVLSDLGSAPAIIIDIRDNRGGSENVGMAIAARFYDKERVYRFGRFRNGPSHDDFGSL